MWAAIWQKFNTNEITWTEQKSKTDIKPLLLIYEKDEKKAMWPIGHMQGQPDWIPETLGCQNLNWKQN